MVTPRQHRLGQVALIAGALALAAVAVAPGDRGAPRAVPVGARPGDLTLEPWTFQTDSGRYLAERGTLVASESRTRADSRLMSLPVVRIHATGHSPAEPIFWLAGGPGMSNLQFKPPAALLESHDVVMVGYRGVDGSTVLDCPEYTRALRMSHPLSAQSLAKLGETMGQCLERLGKLGIDLASYTIPDVVADLEAARVALGYERVNLLSESYGTRVAQVYARLHPERIHRSAMIGVNPPGRFIWEPETIDSQLRHYANLWAQDPKRRALSSDLAETVRAVVHDMPRRWLFLPIDPDKVRVTAFVLLFNRQTAAMVFDAFVAAEHGDPSGLALLSLAYDFVVPSAFTWGDLFAKAVSADLDPTRDYVAEMDPPKAILGSPVSKLQWGSAPRGGWPIPVLPADLRRAEPSAVEALLVRRGRQ